MNKHFLLSNETAKTLYGFAKELPVIDYHNHLSLGSIRDNERFTDVYDLWIKPDPYKHRAMRMCGVEEKYITGDADNKVKFKKWCETVPGLLGNPLYHWAVTELNAVFGAVNKINGENADMLYEACNKYLSENEITAKSLLKQFNVEYACPCASLTDDISVFHGDNTLAPSLRGDDIVSVSAEFISKLESLTDIKIDGIEAFKKAVSLRLEVFDDCGCRFSDHTLDNGFGFYPDDGKNAERFKNALNGTVSAEDKERLASYILVFLGNEYAKRSFVMQLHIGAERYTSSALRNKVGPAGGFAGIGNSVEVKSLTRLLDTLDTAEYGLPKTVLFTLNPADNALISVLSGSYSKDGVKGLITQGPAWWWCDHKLGILDVLENTACFGVLSNFIGMTTDSRSFMSFVRHDYFRRLLCDLLGKKYENGEFYCSFEELKDLVFNLCYGNAKEILK